MIIVRDTDSVHSLTIEDSEFQKLARQDFTALMQERLVIKPYILNSLLPAFSIGCRRLTPGPGYLEALTEDNVDFIDTPISKAQGGRSIVLANGETKDLDVLICATRFQASAPHPSLSLASIARLSKQSSHPTLKHIYT